MPRGPTSQKENPFDLIYVDTVPNPVKSGITVDASTSTWLVVVDKHSKYIWFTGIKDRTCKSTIAGIEKFSAKHNNASIKGIRSDAGNEFIGKEFTTWCDKNHIAFSAAAPEHQHQNGICER